MLPARAHLRVSLLQIYTHVNNGVYRSGFATTQAAYDEVQRGLYRTLDALESRLSDSRFLLGGCCRVSEREEGMLAGSSVEM